MLPLFDINPRRLTPVINYSLLVANGLIWLWEYSLMTRGVTWLTAAYGMVPARLSLDPAGELFTLLTSMFMHGDWLHLIGNMLVLHVFGDNIEDALGHVRYVIFYLLGGFAAAAAQYLIDPLSTVPMVGASGAIAAVLGAYMVLYPKAQVAVLNPIPFLWLLTGPLIVAPAWLVIGFWIVFENVLKAIPSLALAEHGGVAFFAHIGGFVGGLLLVRPFMRGRSRAKPDVWQGWKAPPRRRPPPDIWNYKPGDRYR